MATTNVAPNDDTQDDETTTPIDDQQDDNPSDPPDPTDTPDDRDDDDSDLTPKTPRERKMVQAARQQEKRKLYDTQEDLKNTIKGLKDRLKTLENKSTSSSTSSTNRRASTRNDDDEANDLRSTILKLSERLDEQDATNRRNALKQYKRTVISELKASKTPFVEALIDGESEEEIDTRAEIAVLEAQTLLAEHGNNGDVDDDNQQPRNRQRTVRNGGGRPAGVPPMPVRSSRSGDRDQNDGSYTLKQLQNIVRNGAGVRGGDWAKHRKNVLAALEQGRILRDN